MEDIAVEDPIFICAGEASGDLYAAFFVKRLRKTNPSLKIYGVGGEQLFRSKVEVVKGFDKLKTLGFFAGILSVFRNYEVYRNIARKMYKVRVKMFIAVAYPGLNLLLCRYAKKMGSKVYFLLPPQIWAWGTFRKYFVKKWVDKVISVFPFEYEFYRSRGITTMYLENPLFDELGKYKRKNHKKKIGFMPGSRNTEIKRNLPVIIALMDKIASQKPEIEFSIILHSKKVMVDRGWLVANLKNLIRTGYKKTDIITENRYQAMKNCDLLIVSSGTASLEAAIMNIPQIFFNRPAFFDYYIFRTFLKIKEYNLTNLYFKQKIVPSIVSFDTGYIVQNLYKKIKNHLLNF
jgi:lipid-A-disaccharide synthase